MATEEEKNRGRNKATVNSKEERRTLASDADRTASNVTAGKNEKTRRAPPLQTQHQRRQQESNQKSPQSSFSKVVSDKQPSKGRYFVGVKLNDKIVPILIDTGADVSLCSKNYAEQGIRAKLRKPFSVKGNDGETRTKI